MVITAKCDGPQRRCSLPLLLLGAFASSLLLISVLLIEGSDRHGWQMAARYTARLSACMFLPAYLASALARLRPRPWTQAVLRERRGLGLAFFAAHAVHLLAIAGAVARGTDVSTVTLAAGGIAYLLVFAMAASSNDRAVARLGARRWKRLHRLGIHYTWFIFTLSYAGRVAETRAFDASALLSAALLAALVLRLIPARPLPP